MKIDFAAARVITVSMSLRRLSNPSSNRMAELICFSYQGRSIDHWENEHDGGEKNDFR